MPVTFEPEPSEEEREVVLAALRAPRETDDGWSRAALLEGVESELPDP